MNEREGPTDLEAVAEALRAELARVVDRSLAGAGDPLDRLRLGLGGLFDAIEAAPRDDGDRARWLAVLTVAGASTPGVTRVRSTLTNIVVALVEDARRDGVIGAGPTDEMAHFLLAGVTETLNRWRADGFPAGLAARGQRLFDLWLDGARGRATGSDPDRADDAGEAAPAAGSVTPMARPEASPVPARLDDLDVRPILDSGRDPLADIRAALDDLPPGSVLHITAPFRPAPLETFLRTAGHSVHAVPLGSGAWSVAVVVGGGFDVADLRELEPPGPMESVLTSTVNGGPYAARMPRTPRLLFPQLERRGVTYQLLELDDGTALLWVAP